MNTLFQGIQEAVDFYNTPIVKRRLESHDPVRGAFECAYFDTQRTFRGMGKVEAREQIKQEIFEIVKHFYEQVSKNFVYYQLADFDGAHNGYCNRIIEVGNKYDFTIYYGQAQKIINMFFKYILLVDERLNVHLNYFHVPLDGIILGGIVDHYADNSTLVQAAKKCMPWSKISDSADYRAVQNELRKLHECPIVFEFTVWKDWQA